MTENSPGENMKQNPFFYLGGITIDPQAGSAVRPVLNSSKPKSTEKG